MSINEHDEALNGWINDFVEAKNAFSRLNLLIKDLFRTQQTSTHMLSVLFGHYANVVTETPEENVKYTKYFAGLEKYSQQLEADLQSKISTCQQQLSTAKTEIQHWLKLISKVKKSKPETKIEDIKTVESKLPSFLSILDAFMTRFTLKLKTIQAEHSKKLMDIFNTDFSLSSIEEIRKTWFTAFETVMLAVESMKYVNAHVSDELEDRTASEKAAEKASGTYHDTLKSLQSKLSRHDKPPEFKNKMGFFHEYIIPNEQKSQLQNSEKSEYVVAIYDFHSEEQTDLPFVSGDKIKVVDKGTKDDPNWWCGELNGKLGLFPRNYVRLDGLEDIEEYVPSVRNSVQGSPTQKQEESNVDELL